MSNILSLSDKIKNKLKDMGLEPKLYNGHFKTDVKIVVSYDRTPIYFSHDLSKHRVIVINE